MPPNETVLCAWVVSQAGRIQYKTIKAHLCAIRSLAIDQGHEVPTFEKMNRLQRVLRGIRRVHGDRNGASLSRLPITANILRTMYPHLNLSRHNDRMMWCAMVTSMVLMLRCGEIAVTHRTNPPPLLRRHLEWKHRSEYELTIPTSKTDPFRVGTTLHAYQSGHIICPVTAMHEYLDQFPSYVRHTPTSPLFMFDDGNPLTRTALIGCVRTLAIRVGIDPLRCNGHSFRRGGATTLSLAGVPNHLIQALGRWRSDAYKRYIDTSNNQLRTITIAMCRPTM